MEQYSKEHNTTEQPSKQYFKASTLPEIIKTYAFAKKGAKPSDIDKGEFFFLSFFLDLEDSSLFGIESSWKRERDERDESN